MINSIEARKWRALSNLLDNGEVEINVVTVVDSWGATKLENIYDSDELNEVIENLLHWDYDYKGEQDD